MHNELVQSSGRRLKNPPAYQPSHTPSDCSEDCDIEQFRQEIKSKFHKSVANKIYSFPLLIAKDDHFFSESSDGEGLEGVKQYDLRSQNRRDKRKEDRQIQKERERQDRLKSMKSQEERIRRVRERSQESRRRYAGLLQLLEGAGNREIAIKENEQVRDPQKSYRREKNEPKTKPFANKTNRLKTQPDESIKSTHRINIALKNRK